MLRSRTPSTADRELDRVLAAASDVIEQLGAAVAEARAAQVAARGADAHYLYEDFGDGLPVPRLPVSASGRPTIQAEPAAALFDLRQAARHFGREPEMLRRLWLAAFSGLWSEVA